ncbi:MAG TPA: alkaline phosphatase family protein [Polyangia bacterium]|nr:alkaline phosphatase family protein [Polyangia bacterium]
MSPSAAVPSRRIISAVALATTLAACGAPASAPAGTPAQLAAPVAGCSDLTRAVLRYEQDEKQLCGSADEWWQQLIPVGGGHFLSWVIRTGEVRMWSLGADGTFSATATTYWPPQSNHVLANLGGARVLRYDQRYGSAELMTVNVDAQGLGDPVPERLDEFSLGRELSGRAFVTIDDTHLLSWMPDTGAYQVLFIDRAHEQTNPLPATSFSGSLDALRRGHDWVALGAGRLLEWVPLTGAYRVWKLDLSGAGGDAFVDAPVASGRWSDLTVDHQILLVDTDKILVWNRSTGELALRKYDATAPDPLSGAPISRIVFESLTSLPHGWGPPTTSAIKRVVLILQDGRSFDSYFGRRCQAAPGSAPTCTDGPACCEAMPATTPGANDGCRVIDLQTSDFVPNTTSDCLADEIDGGRMDRFVTSSLMSCGDPRNFACAMPVAAPNAADVDVGVYHAFADQGALADRFFQSFRGSAEVNFLFLARAGLGASVASEGGEEITSQLTEKNVPFALYLGDPDQDAGGHVPPIYYDGEWAPLRSVSALLHDVDYQQLAPVTAVIAPPPLSERPGVGVAADGIRFVQSVVASVLASPTYKDDTLVLVGYFTGGGFYDHVAPPPPSAVDHVPYGPRVPLLALGPFARANVVSHVPLELSSITKFVEWNWLGGVVGQLRGRDVTANNLGSLVVDDPKTGQPIVPTGP